MLKRILSSMAIAFAVTLLINIYVISTSGGFNDAPRYSFIAARASSANANLFWCGVAAIVTALVLAMKRHGPGGVWQGVVGTPGRIGRAAASPWMRLGMALGFAAAYWAASPLLTRTVLLTATAASLLLAPTRGLSVLTWRAASVWGRGGLSPSGVRAFSASIRGALLGAGAALLLLAFVDAGTTRKLIALGIVAILWFWSRSAPLPRSVVGALWVLAVVHLATDWLTAPLWADDGTWRDDSTVGSWWTDGGNEVTSMAGDPAAVASGTAGLTAAADDDDEVISPGSLEDLLGTVPPPDPNEPGLPPPGAVPAPPAPAPATPPRPVIDIPLGGDDF